MKKIFTMAAVIAVASGAAMADFQSNTPQQAAVNARGGFVGGSEVVSTVKQAKEMRDDVPVIVQGKILQRMGDDKYLFEDATDSITVEIDDEDWRGQTVTPNDTVKLYGEIDSGMFKTEIDVDYVEKL